MIKGRNLEVYPDEEMALAISRAIAKETPRGWRITKEKSSHKIDVVVALAFACLACVQKGTKAKTGYASLDIDRLVAPSYWKEAGDGGVGYGGLQSMDGDSISYWG